MNPNHESTVGGMNGHATEVWEKHVVNSGFSNLLIIAHSAGGGCLSSIQK